jgi:hypothetical protein
VIESRKHSGGLSPADSHELEALVFDLVRERLLKAVGAAGMWTLQFRGESDTDSLFGETIAEFIARDIATHIASPVAVSSDDVRAEPTATEDEIAQRDTPWVGSESPSEMSLEANSPSQPEINSELEADANTPEVAAGAESITSKRAA